MAPVPVLIRIGMGGIADEACRRAEVVLEEARGAERSRIIAQVKAHRFHGVIIEIQRKPGMELNQIQPFTIRTRDGIGRRLRLSVRRREQGALLRHKRLRNLPCVYLQRVDRDRTEVRPLRPENLAAVPPRRRKTDRISANDIIPAAVTGAGQLLRPAGGGIIRIPFVHAVPVGNIG